MSESEPTGLSYGLEDRPRAMATALFGLQWLVLFLPLVVITSALFTRDAGLGEAAAVGFYVKTLLVCGLAMIVQPLWGHRLPLVDGPAAVLLLTSLNLVGQGLDVVAGGMMVGGAVLFLTALCGGHRPLIRLFTPNVVAAVLLLIVVTITPLLTPLFMGRSGAPPGVDLFGLVLTPMEETFDAWRTALGGDPVSAGVALGLCVLMAMAGFRLRGVWKSLSLFLGVAFGLGVMAALGRVDWSPLADSAWLALPGGDLFSPVSFRVSAALAFVVSYVALVINQVGSITAVEPVVKAKDIDRRTRRSLGLNGCFGALAGALGVIGPVSYSLSPGVIKVTGVGSRFPVAAAGVMCLIVALSPKAAGLMAA
ncbi:MAG: purine/pyrimidine permease, partial [Proteobacteria bacterium]|nr:purine/pyrimidine permease [Pseudomonadota bacterium]